MTSPQPTMVIPGVFIGNIDSIGPTTRQNKDTPTVLEELNIKYIVSVCVEDVELPVSITNHLRINVTDEDGSDLLTYFPAANNFITQALANDVGVLVHCVSGISRSATVVMAYVMHAQQLPCPKAFRVVKKKHRPSCPNEGFRRQLKLYEAMGYTLDVENPEFRMYRLQNCVENNLGDLGTIPLARMPNREDIAKAQITLQCRKCRYLFGTDRNLITHDPGKGQLAFSWHRREGNTVADDTESLCSSLFIEPMEWMTELVEAGGLQGKLCCPKCKSRWGTYNWSGSQCSCGTWITPSFQMPRSRIDCNIPTTQLSKFQHDNRSAMLHVEDGGATNSSVAVSNASDAADGQKD
eukprot:m.468757 g.468757  ORF g.468757 m.468757 type:complete len:352 (-) comp21647_c1_seq1:164-1219(-)